LQGHAEPAWMPLRDEEFFTANDIEIWREKEAAKVDTAAQTITFSDGKILEFDSLLIASGGTPRRLPFQTGEEKNVFLLRSFADSDAIIAAAEAGKRVVVVGASFIGMEAASSLRERGCEVTVVAPDKVPFEKILGAEIGKLFQKIHERKGVNFKLGTQVKNFEGAGSRIEAVRLENGERVEADFVVVGIGVNPATGFLEGAPLNKDGGVIADEFLRVAENVYAAGDIAHFPDSRSKDRELLRVEHWRFAMQQGRTAARNMAGGHEPFTAVPFFWTTQFGARLNYVGHAKDWDKILIQGDVQQQDFLALYVKDGHILAVAGMNRDREMADWEELIRQNRVPSPDELTENSVNSSEQSNNFIGLF
jgi:apoptosis-inducing factor 3